MRALERFDELFLAQDSGVTVGHSGGLVIFDAAGASDDLSAEGLRERVEQRLDHLPVLRRRPEPDPERRGRHRWAEDESVDLAAHVHGQRLDGGDDRALGRLVAELNAPALDHSRPLWEWHVIDGLQDGRVATYLKFHHALGDAVPGREVIETVFAAEEEVERVFVGGGEDPPPSPDAAPADPPPTAPASRFNQPLSAQRDFAFTSFERERIERIRSASGVTFTDVLLAAWAGALRGWLAMRGEAPAVPLVARLPISLRRADDDSASANRLAVVAVGVPADEAAAEARLRRAHQAMARAKQVAHSGARSEIGVAVNLALSTFVGSNFPLAWGDAPYVGSYPLPMVHMCGLSIASVTGPEYVWTAVHVDAEQVADPWSLLRAFDLALDDLEKAAGS